MQLYFAVPDTATTHDGVLVRSFLRQCAVSTDLARAVKFRGGGFFADGVPVTGRTHQIRVHFASIGHPLAGDDLYGGSRERIARQALHCARQSFAVPVYTPLPDGIRVEMPLQLRTVTVESPLPPDMEALFS